MAKQSQKSKDNNTEFLHAMKYNLHVDALTSPGRR